MLQQEYDVIIIGAGPAGIGASVYATRKGLKTLLISESFGGQVSDVLDIKNYIGFDHISGKELVNHFKKQVESLDVPILLYEKVLGVTKREDFFEIITSKDILKSKALILALGAKPRSLNLKGEEEFVGRGVSYCTTCDAPFYKDLNVVVYGLGNIAATSTLDLSKVAKEVVLVTSSVDKISDDFIYKLKEAPNVKILENSQLKEIIGSKTVEKVVILNKKTRETSEIQTSGVFIEMGHTPSTSWLKDLVKLNEYDEIIVDLLGRTSVEGLFAAGDATNIPFKQMIISAGDGAKAALSANAYLQKKNERNVRDYS